jgi:transaldolase
MQTEQKGITIMKNNSLKQLETLEQTVWLDSNRRDLIASGALSSLIREDGLRGMTSNPSISQKAVKHVASVASFFVSRIDALVDPLLQLMVAQGGRTADVAKDALGNVAVASAKMAYQIYREIFESDRFRSLAAEGARVQRLLWASTGAKNPDHSDVKYVEALIGPDTVNTATPATLDAYRDHGDPQARLERDVAEAARVLKRLPELGISLDKLTQQLEDEGVTKFNQPFDKLMETLAQRSP